MTIDAVHKTLLVPWMPQQAFHLFVSRIGEWWPLATHCRADKEKGEHAVSATIEPHAGGRFYEVLSDDRKIDWGEVLAYKPGELLLLSWQLGSTPEQATEVEVIFSPAGAQTQIDLIHRNWKNLGPRGLDMRNRYDQGWDGVLGHFYVFAKTQKAA